MSGTGGFQTQVEVQPQQAVAGDFSTQNPYFTLKAGPGGLVAGGPNGVQVGRFAWTYPQDDVDGSPTIVQNFGNGPVAGFVHREQQGLITQYLSNAGMTIQPGFQMGLMVGGDFWVVNSGTSMAQINQKAFAYLATGLVAFAAAGSVFGGASATGSSVAAQTAQVVGSLSDDILTVSGVNSGTVYPGSTLSGTGVAAGTQIVSQISGTVGGVGQYYVNVGGQAPTGSGIVFNLTYGLLTIGTLQGTTPFAVGDQLSGSGVVAGTFITANVSGTGGSGGTMVVNNNTVVGAATITASVAVETPWYAQSTGIAGALVAISDHSSSQLQG